MDRVTNRVWEAHDVVPAFLGASFCFCILKLYTSPLRILKMVCKKKTVSKGPRYATLANVFRAARAFETRGIALRRAGPPRFSWLGGFLRFSLLFSGGTPGFSRIKSPQGTLTKEKKTRGKENHRPSFTMGDWIFPVGVENSRFPHFNL